jgi:predicted membrane protein
MQKSRWFWGSLFFIGAALLILAKLGWQPWGISPITLIISVALIAGLIQSIIYRQLSGVVMIIALLLIIYSKPLGIAAFAPWTIFWAAILIIVGLNIIIPTPYQQRWHHSWHGSTGHFDAEGSTETSDQNTINLETHMGTSVRYVQSPALQKVNIINSLSTSKIYFEQATLAQTGAVINVDCHLGSIELYFPREWHVTTEIHSSLGGVEEHGFHSSETTTGPALTIRGNIHLGGLTIHYI